MLYCRHESPIHRLSPAGKIVLLLLFFVWAMLFTAPAYTLAPLLAALAGIVAARALGNLRKVLPVLLLFALLSLLLWSVMAGGTTPLLRLGPVTIYREALAYAVAVALRLDAMLLAGVVFLSSTGIEQFRLGLCQLRVPYVVAFTIGMVFRLAPTFAGTLEKAVAAQKSRGLDLDGGGPLQRLRGYAPLIIPVILLSLRNTDQLAVALEARGFARDNARTSYLHHPWRATDTLALVLGLLILAAAIALRLHGYGLTDLGGSG